MSTGSLSLDILLNSIIEDSQAGGDASVGAIVRQFPSLSDKEAEKLRALVFGALAVSSDANVSLVATTPPSFSIKALSTRNTVKTMIENASSSILITGYSLSDYFSDVIDCIIQKSQSGIFVKFFVNQIENQSSFDKLQRYKGHFLKIYNYPQSDDKMAALHAKVISVDKEQTLITSANLSYHGQEGNIELGMLVNSKETAKEIDNLFTQLIFKKVFVEV